MEVQEPKYRRLTQEELLELEKEFVDFLIVNGITADQWVRIKEEDQDAAQDLITLFSDVVLEGSLRKIRYLEFRSKNDLKVFQCLAEKIVLVGMTSETTNVDFTDEEFILSAIKAPPSGLKVYTTDKSYSKDRQKELFDMVQSGCLISDGKLFKALSLAMASVKMGE